MDLRKNDGEHKNEDKPEETIIPVIEEQAKIEKKTIETGKVKIHKQITEEEVEVDAPLMHEDVEIESIDKNEFVDELPPPVRQEGDTTIISVLKEVIVVRTVLVKELRITKKRSEEARKEKIRLRKENVNIERDEQE